MKIQPRLKYDAIQVDDEIKLLGFLMKNGIELLKVKLVDSEDDLLVAYYATENKSAESIEFKYGWYIWVDEFGIVNSGSQDYVSKNFNIFDDTKIEREGKIIKVKR